MYDFIDVTEVSEGLSLPSEALKINGEYIEDQISGYRTLTVEGREALSPEISSFETGSRDGSVLKGKRYPARVIRITYQLVASSNEEFRNAYNKLASVLNVTNAELVFNDETDKYFIGTPSLVGEVPPGKNSVVGEFEILCLDPFKYSLMEYEAVPDLDDSSILLDYQGTYKSFPKLEAAFYSEDETSEDGETTQTLTGAGDCGFVSFFTEDEKIIQLGDPDEVDKVNEYPASQTLVNHKFDGPYKWGTSPNKLWSMNNGATSSADVTQAGSLQMGVASYAKGEEQTYSSGTLLKITSKADSPYMHYTVTAKMTSREESTAKVTVMISVRLDNSESFFGSGYILQACVKIGETTKKVILKESPDYWSGTTEHKRSVEFTVTGLTTAAKTITGIKFYTERLGQYGGTAGLVNETECSPFKIAAKATDVPSIYYLTPLSYGTGAKWHGPSITRAIPADNSGEVGAKNFTLTYAQKMCIGENSGAASQYGAFQVMLWATKNNQKFVVAGASVRKEKYGNTAKVRCYVNGKTIHENDISIAYNSKVLKPGVRNTIRKSGAHVEIRIGDVFYAFDDEAIKDVAVTNVTFTFSKYSGKATLSHNGLCWAKFVKNNCDTWKNIPNKFSANDVIEADCRTGEIRLNGLDAAAYGALGNDWEGFCLTPGLNRIGFAYSDWVAKEYAPSFKVKYREVFL